LVPLLRNSPLIVSEVGKLVPVRIAVALLSADMGNLGGHCWTAGEHEKQGVRATSWDRPFRFRALNRLFPKLMMRPPVLNMALL